MRYVILTILVFGIIIGSSLILNHSASAQVQIDPASVYYNDSGNYVPYKLIQNSNSATVLSKDGSFVFNKNSCSISFYNNTNTNGNPVLGNDTYQVLASLGNSGVWNPVSIINNAACNTSVTEHNGTVSVIGSKSVAGAGVFSVNYTKVPLQPLKLSFSATNNNPSWTNYHIGLRETLQVPKLITLGNQTYDLSQYNNTVLNRNWISSHRSQLIQLSSNTHYDMGLGWNNVSQITVHWINNKAFLDIDYTYNTPILLPGTTIVVDPAIYYDGTGKGTAATSSSLTYSVTVGNNSNRMLIVWVANENAYPSGVTYNGVAMTNLDQENAACGGTGLYNSLWYLISPNTGTHNVVVSSTAGDYISSIANSYYSVKQSSPFGTPQHTNQCSRSSPISTSVTTSVSNSIIVSGAGWRETTYPSSVTSSTLTIRNNEPAGGHINYAGDLNAITTGSYSATWTYSGDSGTVYAITNIAVEMKSVTILTPSLIKVNTINSTAINATWTNQPGTTWSWLNTTLSGGATTHINTTKTFVLLNNYTAGSRYTFSLVNANGTGKSSSSITKYNYTFNVAPTIPTLTNILSSQMRLGWTNPTGGANLTGGFNIYKVTALGSNYTLIAQTANNTNHYDSTSLQGNREYTFKIATRYAVGTNYTGASANSTTVSAYTLPSPPTSLTATQSLSLTAHLSWIAATDNGTQLGYKIEQSTDGGSTWSTKIANTGNSTTHADIIESSSGNYKFRVDSIKYGGTSSPSNTASLTVWNGLLITIVKSDNATKGAGNIYQSNSTSKNNVFSASSGTVVIPSLFNNQNFTFKDSSTLFVTGKSYNVNATSPNTLRMITNDFYVDCASDGTGTDFEWFTNGTNNHIIKVFTSPICYTNNTVKWKVYWQSNGNSIQNDTSTIRIQVLNNTFGMNPTKVTANGTTIITSYAAPWIISNSFTVANGLTNAAIYFSANMALNPAYIPTNYTAGNLNVTGSNNNIQPIQISSSTEGSNTVVTFTYPTTYTLGVNANMLLENKTAIFTGLPRTTIDAAHVSSSITFKNATNNDVIKIKAYDINSNNNANYSLSMNSGSIPILTQIANFRNGTYGTHGQFGSIDLIVLIVLIFSMIGLNRVSETVGLIFNLVVIGGFSFYGILPFDKTIYAGIAMIALIIVGSTKKLPWS